MTPIIVLLLATVTASDPAVASQPAGLPVCAAFGYRTLERTPGK